MYEGQSEVAQLRERMLLKSQASWWALHGLASGHAQHEYIAARLKKMNEYHGLLVPLVGEEQATDCYCEALEEGKHERIGH